AATGRPAGGPLPHQATIDAVVFSPDGQTVLTGSRDHTARLWEAASGKPRTDPLPHGAAVAGVAFSPRGRLFVTVCSGGAGSFWDASGGRAGEAVTVPRVERWAVFTRGGHLVLASGDGAVWLVPVPAARGGSAGAIKRWVEDNTGLELDDSGAVLEKTG